MKKINKLFNVTVGGYYVCSIILGVLTALVVIMATHDIYVSVWDNAYDYWWKALRVEEADSFDGLTQALNNAYDYAEITVGPAHDFLPARSFYDWLVEMRIPFEFEPFVMFAMAVVVIILSVCMMEGKGANKVWRTKMLQALLGVAPAVVCLELAFEYAWLRALREISPAVAWIPVLAFIVPLCVLLKTRQRTRKETKANAEVEIAA